MTRHPDRPIDKTKRFADIADEIQGNAVFDAAAAELGVDPAMARVLLNGLLLRAGKTATGVTAADLLALLPDVEARLSTMVRPDQGAAAVARLRTFLARR
jgi:hypothetical protein